MTEYQIHSLENTSCTIDRAKELVHFFATDPTIGDDMATKESPNSFSFEDVRGRAGFDHWIEVVALINRPPVILINTN